MATYESAAVAGFEVETPFIAVVAVHVKGLLCQNGGIGLVDYEDLT